MLRPHAPGQLLSFGCAVGGGGKMPIAVAHRAKSPDAGRRTPEGWVLPLRFGGPVTAKVGSSPSDSALVERPLHFLKLKLFGRDVDSGAAQ